MDAAPTVSERLRAARRMLFGRGDDAVACSFCGRDRLGGSDIVAGPRVAICGACAHTALEAIWAQSAQRSPPGTWALDVIVSIAPICLVPAARADLPAHLARTAGEFGCTVLGWSLTSGTREDGDYLYVRLARPDDETSPNLHESFLDAVLEPGATRRPA